MSSPNEAKKLPIAGRSIRYSAGVASWKILYVSNSGIGERPLLEGFPRADKRTSEHKKEMLQD